MTTVRRFQLVDLLRYSNINLDALTETVSTFRVKNIHKQYNNYFYFHYVSQWPDYFYLTENSNKRPMGYSKAEGKGEEWHGHVTAVTVAPEFRRVGLASILMSLLEEVTTKVYDAYFVDLFVRASNWVAISMYTNFGYEVYRRVLEYYSGEEDAFDMRKPMARDKQRHSLIKKKEVVRPEELD